MLDFDTLVSAQILILAVALTAAFLSGQRRRSLFLLLGATPFGLCVAWGALFEATPKALQERFAILFENAPLVFGAACLLATPFLIWRMPGARIITAIFMLCEIPVTGLLIILALMAITGRWI